MGIESNPLSKPLICEWLIYEKLCLFKYMCTCNLLCGTFFARLNNPCHEKTGFLPMRKQRRKSAVCSNCTADQRLCFRYTDSIITLLLVIRNFKLTVIFCVCKHWFVSDLVGNCEDRFSHIEAQMCHRHYNLGHYEFIHHVCV